MRARLYSMAMAHEVETMFSVGVAPWHGLGARVPAEVTSGEAMKLAGLDWRVSTQPLLTARGDGSEPALVPSARAVVRETDGRPLGVVGERYLPIQNADAFAFFDEIVGAGKAIYHTAGSLKSGRRVWILSKLPGEVRVARNDITEKFLLLSNSHDGSSALRMMFTPVRVVCQNTLNIALAGGERAFHVRHTASAPSRIEEARRVLGLSNTFYDSFAATAHRLAASRYTDAQMRELTTELFPGETDKPSSRTANIRDKVLELFETGAGHGEIRGTAWAALNAVAEFTDHHRQSSSQNRDGRVDSIWWGSGASLKARAYQLIDQQLVA